MHLIVGEVAPVAPLLIPIGYIVMWGVFLALCLGVTYVAKAFFGTASGTIGKLPVLGHWIDGKISVVEHKLTATLGQASAYADAQIGAAFHSLARIVDYIGHEIEAHANLLAVLAQAIAGQTLGLNLWGQIGRIRHFEGALVKQISQLVRRQIAQDERIARGIGADVLPRIRTIERETARVVNRDIPSVRARERALAREVDRLWSWTHRHTLAAGTATFAGAVAFALARLGAGWVRCSNWRKIGRGVCGAPASEIDALMGLFAAGATIASFRQLVELGQEVEHGVAATLQEVAKL